MASTDQLQRILDLSQRLDRLDDKHPGMPIAAAEWNDLVTVLRGVLDVDRRQEEAALGKLEKLFARHDHQHLGQVSASWLDPELQAASADGGGASLRSELARMRNRLDELQSSVAALTARVEAQIRLLDDLEVRDVDRAKQIRVFDDRFSAVGNLQTLVTKLSQQVTGVSGNLDTVLALRASLSDAQGNPIDVAALREQVRGLDNLRENLKGVDGNLLRLRDVELKLDELSDAVGVGDGLDERLGVLVGNLETRLFERQEEHRRTLSETLTAAQEERLARLETRVDQRFTAIRADLDTNLTTRVDGLRQSLRGEVDERFTSQRTQLRGELSEIARSVVADEARAISDSRAATEETLRRQLSERLDADLAAAIGEAGQRSEARIAALETRLAAAQTRSEQRLQQQLQQSLAEHADLIERRLSGRFDEFSRNADARIHTAATGAVESALPQVEARLASGLDQRLSGLDQIVAQRVAAAVGDLDERIRGAIGGQLQSLDLEGKIAAAETRLDGALSARITQAIADQRANSTRALNAAVEQLRGEIGPAVKAGMEEAIQRSASLIAETRNEIDRSITGQITGVNQLVDDKLERLRGSVNVAIRKIEPTITVDRIILGPIGPPG
jgi:hypothetical protein